MPSTTQRQDEVFLSYEYVIMTLPFSTDTECLNFIVTLYGWQCAKVTALCVISKVSQWLMFFRKHVFQTKLNEIFNCSITNPNFSLPSPALLSNKTVHFRLVPATASHASHCDSVFCSTREQKHNLWADKRMKNSSQMAVKIVSALKNLKSMLEGLESFLNLSQANFHSSSTLEDFCSSMSK